MEHSSVHNRNPQKRPDMPRRAEETGPRAAGRPPLHPISGLTILLLDMALFGGEFVSLELATPVLALIGFVAGFACTAFFQKVLSRDSMVKSVVKGLLAGVVVGLPMPIAGTFVGTLILSWSGLNFLKKKFAR